MLLAGEIENALLLFGLHHRATFIYIFACLYMWYDVCFVTRISHLEAFIMTVKVELSILLYVLATY